MKVFLVRGSPIPLTIGHVIRGSYKDDNSTRYGVIYTLTSVKEDKVLLRFYLTSHPYVRKGQYKAYLDYVFNKDLLTELKELKLVKEKELKMKLREVILRLWARNPREIQALRDWVFGNLCDQLRKDRELCYEVLQEVIRRVLQDVGISCQGDVCD